MPSEQSFQDVFIASADETPNSVILMNVIVAGVVAYGRVRSLKSGHDARFVTGARPLTTRRRRMMQAAIATHAIHASASVAQAVLRARTEPEATYGYENKTSKELFSAGVDGVVYITLAAYKLKRGKSFISNRELSTYGKSVDVLGMSAAALRLGLVSREAYRRRASWAPKAKMYASVAPSVAKASVKNLRKKNRPNVDKLRATFPDVDERDFIAALLDAVQSGLDEVRASEGDIATMSEEEFVRHLVDLDRRNPASWPTL